MPLNIFSCEMLDRHRLQLEERLAADGETSILNLSTARYYPEILRYVFLTCHADLIDGLEAVPQDCLLYNRFYWHNIVRGILQKADSQCDMFLDDMDDILGSPSHSGLTHYQPVTL